ncbi:MAG TPA: tripartite tricarboxylate transporter substrate binding protein [Roseomonas sp.]|jgi:tripartite-type tricarboxylate transporter receptor subunit TctC
MSKAGFGRRAWLAGTAALTTGRAAQAQAYPARVVRVVIPYAAGGGADTVGRLFCARLVEHLGQQFVIENRGGGGGTIGANAVARAANDGYTLLYDSSAFAVNPFLQPSLPFDTIRDFAPVFLAALVPTFLVVHPSIEARTVPELVEHVKRAAGGVECASPGNGTVQHLAVEMFRIRTGAQLNHVPYRGGAPAMNDLVAGQIKIGFVDGAAAMSFVRAGSFRAIAHCGSGRLATLPGLPAMAESVRDFAAVVWNGFIAPAGTPPPVIRRLNATLNDIIREPAFASRLEDINVGTRANTPEAFQAFLAAEMAQWGALVREARITLG